MNTRLAFDALSPSGRGCALVRTSDPDLLDWWLKPEPSGFENLHLHRRTNAPRLVAKLGAWLHGANIGAFEMRSAVKPSRTIVLCVDNPALDRDMRWLHANIAHVGMGSQKLIERDTGWRLWSFLTEWIAAETTVPRGWRSLEEEQAEMRSIRECAELNRRAAEGDQE